MLCDRSVLTKYLTVALLLAGASLVASCLGSKDTPHTLVSLTAFSSANEFDAWFEDTRKIAATRQQDMSQLAEPTGAGDFNTTISTTQAGAITSNQTKGVDEGDIVKLHKNHLIILRRGRLFTIQVGNNTLAPVDMIDASARNIPGQVWYDELLVSGNTAIVIGYSYRLGTTEINLFRIDESGHLNRGSAWSMRTDDYYTSRNFATRLVEDKLVFYAPLTLNFYDKKPTNRPTLQRWQANRQVESRQILPANRIYRSAASPDPWRGISLHSIVQCKILQTGGDLDCNATAILGPSGGEFYVGPQAVYLWTAQTDIDLEAKRAPATVFRLPLDLAQAPTAIKAWGSPIDQFSFLEQDGFLNVVLRAEGPLATMRHAEASATALSFLRVPLTLLGDGSADVPEKHYTPLPGELRLARLHNRFIGTHLFYSTERRHRSDPLEPQTGVAYALNIEHPKKVISITLPHSVTRIEAMDQSPLLVGERDGNLQFSSLVIKDGWSFTVKPVSHFELAKAMDAETHSHGFFYKPGDADSGLLGLPYATAATTATATTTGPAHQSLTDAPSGVVFLRNQTLGLSNIGSLLASPLRDKNDRCKASCLDWYGNARPLFVGNRIFALLGYEIVEGKLNGDRISEINRISFQ